MRWRAAVSATGHTGQCDPFAGGVKEGGGQLDQPGLRFDRSRLDGGDLVLGQAFPHDLKPARQPAPAQSRT
jgi:hypothetical protein